MSLLIGSNAIQMVSLKTRRLNYNRTTEAKLSLLREVIGKVQKGEDVDVEAMLGTGDPEREKEWEEVMKDLERDVDLWERKADKPNETQTEKSSTALYAAQDAAQVAAQDFATSEGERKPGFY